MTPLYQYGGGGKGDGAWTDVVTVKVEQDTGDDEDNVLETIAPYREYEEEGQRDQTDLLLNFEYGYEAFPTFSAFTREIVEEETETIEIRLVSTYEGPLSWVLGYFNNELENFGESREFTPGFDQFAVDNFGGVQLRPDSLEYISQGFDEEKEEAWYGEISYRFFDRLELTFGYRDYTFEVNNRSGFGLPLRNRLAIAPDPVAGGGAAESYSRPVAETHVSSPLHSVPKFPP